MKAQFHGYLVLFEYTADHWYLEREFGYTTLHLGFPWKITVPAMVFPTDLASLPPPVRPFFRKYEAAKGAVVHDWLSSRNPYMNAKGLDGITRKDADKIFLEAMIVSGVSRPTAYLFYNAVRFYTFFKRA